MGYLHFTSLLKQLEGTESRKETGCLLASFTQAHNKHKAIDLEMTDAKDAMKTNLCKSSLKILRTAIFQTFNLDQFTSIGTLSCYADTLELLGSSRRTPKR